LLISYVVKFGPPFVSAFGLFVFMHYLVDFGIFEWNCWPLCFTF